MDRPTFSLHDISAFPIVRLDLEGRTGSYAEIWAREMDILLSDGRPFTLLVVGNRGEETQEDKKTKAAWFKVNRERLVAICRGFVCVEPDAGKRVALAAQGLQISKAFGLPFEVTETAAEAEALARALARA
ncbi:GntR family transcriptional regulator [Dongia sedimenti]|uniref:GntR family transcriptional regulator n=1 Tax=Dongia sedimenti TaxID=3064282 RepID=A0ABU0YTH1_9PROT|nr:GntR family transcriptional regulator [Rhodospirillaceae bacterium R-7]